MPPRGPSQIYLVSYPGAPSIELRLNDSTVAQAKSGPQSEQYRDHICIAYKKKIGRTAWVDRDKITVTLVRDAS